MTVNNGDQQHYGYANCDYEHRELPELQNQIYRLLHLAHSALT
jgi:hypothetical protein